MSLSYQTCWLTPSGWLNGSVAQKAWRRAAGGLRRVLSRCTSKRSNQVSVPLLVVRLQSRLEKLFAVCVCVCGSLPMVALFLWALTVGSKQSLRAHRLTPSLPVSSDNGVAIAATVGTPICYFLQVSVFVCRLRRFEVFDEGAKWAE